MTNYRLDVSFEYQKSKSKMLKNSLLFSLILAVVIIGDVLLVILAKEDYLINLIIACIITILFGFFAIFYFSNIFSEMDAEYRYYKGYESGLKSTDEVVMLKASKELAYVNGLYVYPLIVRYVSNLETQDKVIYTISSHLDYQEGDKLTITTYERILIEAEKHV